LGPDGASLERWDNNTTAGSVVQSAAPLPFDGYHHVVGVFDGAQLRLYVDAKLEGSNAAVIPIMGTGTPWTIGKQNCSCDSIAFAGSLDELAIYAHALPDDRVAAHSHAGSGR